MTIINDLFELSRRIDITPDQAYLISILLIFGLYSLLIEFLKIFVRGLRRITRYFKKNKPD